MQPDYTHSEYKSKARAENIKAYKSIVGDKIPPDRSYWCLCNEQPVDDGSEICQLIQSGLIKKSQFHGVDRDEDIIVKNRVWHSEASWYAGEWVDVIESVSFKPSFVYLDSTSFADNRIIMNMVVPTMMMCPVGTVLFVNALLNDPRSSKKFLEDKIIKNMPKKLPPFEFDKWDYEIPNYDYSATGKTFLRTYIFHKRG